MSYFLLPEIHNNIDDIYFKSCENNNAYVSVTLNSYLNKVKRQIDEMKILPLDNTNYKHSRIWALLD